MQILLTIKTKNTNDFPDVLHQFAEDLKRDISIVGAKANAIGCSSTSKNVSFDFDYEILSKDIEDKDPNCSLGSIIDKLYKAINN